MPHEGSAERSGSEDDGGLAMVGTFAGSVGSVPCGAAWCLVAGPTQGKPHSDGLTTLTVTVTVEPRGVTCKNRCHILVIFTVTLYLPSGTLAVIKPTSTPQPR